MCQCVIMVVVPWRWPFVVPDVGVRKRKRPRARVIVVESRDKSRLLPEKGIVNASTTYNIVVQPPPDSTATIGLETSDGSRALDFSFSFSPALPSPPPPP